MTDLSRVFDLPKIKPSLNPPMVPLSRESESVVLALASGKSFRAVMQDDSINSEL